MAGQQQRFASDNTVTSILLNGTQITQAGLGTFNQWTSFSAGTGFIGGLNTLSFRLLNLPRPMVTPQACALKS